MSDPVDRLLDALRDAESARIREALREIAAEEHERHMQQGDGE